MKSDRKLALQESSRGERPSHTRDFDPLVLLQSGRGCVPSYWVHGVSGDIGWVFALARAIGEDWPVYGIQARGSNGRHEPLRSIPEMASTYVLALLRGGLEGPIHLGGYSGGGAIAYEMAIQLAEHGIRPSSIVLLDANAPGNLSLADSYVEGFIFLLVGNWLGQQWGAQRRLCFTDLEGREYQEQIRLTIEYLFEEARPRLSREALRHRLIGMDSVCRASREAMDRYRPSPLKDHDLPVLFVRCQQGLGEHGNSLRTPRIKVDGDYRSGWERLFVRPMRVVSFDCDHWQLMADPWCSRMAQSIREWFRC